MRSWAAVAARLGPPLRVGGESDAGPDGFWRRYRTGRSGRRSRNRGGSGITARGRGGRLRRREHQAPVRV